MLLDSQVPGIFNSIYNKFIVDDTTARLRIYAMFMAFYDRVQKTIEKSIKQDLTDKKIFTEESVKNIIIRHKDIISKVIRRTTAGIYDNVPVRSVIGKEKDNNLAEVLKECNYHATVKDAFKKAKFLNLILVIPYLNEDNKLMLDVLTPDNFIITEDPNDYLKIEKLFIQKIRYNYSSETSRTPELYYTVWTKDEHYNLKTNGDKEAIEGNESMRNPYKKIPVSTLRFNSTNCFFPEPNWDLLNAQKAIDIMRTMNFQTQLYQTFGVWIATNLNLKEGEVLSPNRIIKIDNVKNDIVSPGLQCIVPQNDYRGLNENIDFEVMDTYRSEGLTSSSATLEDKNNISGISKMIDEIETEELRNDTKEVLYDFELDLMENVKLVSNSRGRNKIPDGKFELIFSEEKTTESTKDKKDRREMEKEFNIKSDIDFIMEDREISEQEAKKIYEANKKLKQSENPKVENDNDSV